MSHASPGKPRSQARSYWILFLFTWMMLALIIRWHVRGLDREVRREGLSNAAVVACRSVLIDHIDVETGLRGFLVTGRRDYLRPYFEGLGRADQDLAELHAAVRSIPAELAYCDSTEAASRSVFAEFAGQVAVAESSGIDAARARFAAHPTKPDMDRIRAFLRAIQSEEGNLLAENMAALERSLSTTIFLIDAFASISAVLLIAMSFGLVGPPDSRSTPPE